MLKRKLAIAVPASLVSDIPHLREKTAKIGIVGRAAAIFGVDEVIVFRDLLKIGQHREITLISTILSYMETPQYLRKRLFKIRPELRFAGVLPPLRTPHHPLPNRVKDIVDGEYREGATVTHVKDGTLVDVGVEQHALIRNQKIPINTRVTVRVRKTKKLLEAEIADPSGIAEYWGYKVSCSDLTLGKLLRNRGFDLVIATSKHGKSFSEVSKELRNRWEASGKTLVVFGASTRGLYEIAKQENLNLDNVVDYVVNTIPFQKAETVRTEEALFVTLGIFNLMFGKG